MAGLEPAIHLSSAQFPTMDGRVKPGHDIRRIYGTAHAAPIP
jgi:hypothetical protein